MLNNISTFLSREDYRISIINNGLHILNYTSVVDITNDEAIIKINTKIIKIYGTSLRLIELDKKELLLKGIIKKVYINEN